MIVAYEWLRHLTDSKLSFEMPRKSDAARQQLLAFFENLEHELEKVEFLRLLIVIAEGCKGSAPGRRRYGTGRGGAEGDFPGN